MNFQIMMRFVYIYFLLFVLALTCCSSHTTKKNTPNQKAAQKQTSALQTVADNIYELPAEPFKVDIGKALKEAKTINLSEYCDSIEYIPLETRPDFYMGNTTVINSTIYNDHIYYNGRWGSGSKIFNIKGKLVSDKIGTEGRAYGEFSILSNLCINEYTKELVGTDGMNKKLMIYDTLGNFKRAIPFKVITNTGVEQSKFPLGKHFICTAQNSITNEYSLIFRDSSGIVKSVEILGIRPLGIPFKDDSMVELSLQNGLLHILNHASDSIFTYNGYLKKSCSYVINLGKFKIAPESTTNSQFCVIQNIMENNKVAIFICKLRQKNMPYMIKNNLVYLVYDKNDRSCRVLAPDKSRKWFAFNNDIDGGLPFHPVMIKGNRMFQFVDAYNFIKYSKGCSSPKVKEIAATLTEDSNHVMIIANFKGK